MVMRSMRAGAKWIMLFLALAFVGWMVFDVGMNVTGQGGATLTDAAARVNGVKIDVQTYYNALRVAQEQRQTEGTPFGYTLEEQRAFEDAVMERLIQEVLLNQEYRRRGIRVSDAEIIAAAQTSPPPEIVSSPTFQTDGQFDPDKYRRYLSSGVDPTIMLALEQRYRDEIPRIKLYEQLTTDVYVSSAKLWQFYKDQHDSVTVRMIELSPEAMVADSEVTITEAEVAQYYSENQDEFEQPRTAFLSYISTSRLTNQADTLAAGERAESLRQEIRDGADFGEIATRESSDSASRRQGGDLGMLPRGILISEFEDAAIALRDGQISDPVQTAYGYHIIRRERVTSDSIQASHILISIELAGDHLDEIESRADTMDLFGAELDDPGALDDVADMLGVPAMAAPPVTDGGGVGGRMILGGRAVPDAALWAFDALEGETSPVVETDWAYYLFRLDSIRPEGIPPLDAIEATVRRAALSAKKWEMARAVAAEITTGLSGGQHLAEAAIEHLLNFTTLGPMTRRNPAPQLAALPEVVGAAFGLGVSEASPPIETEQAIYFVEPTGKYLSDSTAFLAEREILRVQVLQSAQQDRVQRFMLSLRSGADVLDRRRELDRIQREFDRSGRGLNPFNPLGS